MIGDQVAVTVADSGIGITREALGHIFEMFSQGLAGLPRSQGGLGIGLSLVKELVQLGEILNEVESTVGPMLG